MRRLVALGVFFLLAAPAAALPPDPPTACTNVVDLT